MNKVMQYGVIAGMFLFSYSCITTISPGDGLFLDKLVVASDYNTETVAIIGEPPGLPEKDNTISRMTKNELIKNVLTPSENNKYDNTKILLIMEGREWGVKNGTPVVQTYIPDYYYTLPKQLSERKYFKILKYNRDILKPVMDADYDYILYFVRTKDVGGTDDGNYFHVFYKSLSIISLTLLPWIDWDDYSYWLFVYNTKNKPNDVNKPISMQRISVHKRSYASIIWTMILPFWWGDEYPEEKMIVPVFMYLYGKAMQEVGDT